MALSESRNRADFILLSLTTVFPSYELRMLVDRKDTLMVYRQLFEGRSVLFALSV